MLKPLPIVTNQSRCGDARQFGSSNNAVAPETMFIQCSRDFDFEIDGYSAMWGNTSNKEDQKLERCIIINRLL